MVTFERRWRTKTSSRAYPLRLQNVLPLLFVLHLIMRGFRTCFQDISITAVLPTTSQELRFVQAGLHTCSSILTPQNGIRELVYVVPREDVETFRQIIAPHSPPLNARIEAEDEFVPELFKRKWPGAHKQQVIKMLSYRRTSSTHILFLDSDTMCTPNWNKRSLKRQSFIEQFFVRSWVYKPRIYTCTQSLKAWFGRKQYERTSKYWRIPLNSDFVMGWTPQLMSTEGLHRALQHLQSTQAAADLYDLLFKEPSYVWTEYATYFLSLKQGGSWNEYHYEVRHDFDIDGSNVGVESQIRNCLHVRVNSIESFKRLLNEEALVPMIMLDDHKVNSSVILQIATSVT